MCSTFVHRKNSPRDFLAANLQVIFICMQVCLNVSFSYEALDRLAPNSGLEKFYDVDGKAVAYKVGQTVRSTFLGDPSTGTPRRGRCPG